MYVVLFLINVGYRVENIVILIYKVKLVNKLLNFEIIEWEEKIWDLF